MRTHVGAGGAAGRRGTRGGHRDTGRARAEAVLPRAGRAGPPRSGIRVCLGGVQSASIVHVCCLSSALFSSYRPTTPFAEELPSSCDRVPVSARRVWCLARQRRAGLAEASVLPVPRAGATAALCLARRPSRARIRHDDSRNASHLVRKTAIFFLRFPSRLNLPRACLG